MSTIAYLNRKKQLVKANSEITVPVTGEYFAVLAATGAFKIGVEDGPLSEWEAGLEVGNPVGPNGQRQTFRYLRIADLSGAANIVDFVAGGGDFADRRLTVSGTLNVQGVTGGAPVSIVKASPAASYSQVGRLLGSAANFSLVQLFNPAASGKLVFVDRLAFDTPSLRVAVRSYDTALATLVSSTIGRVDRRSPAPVAEVREGLSAATVGDPTYGGATVGTFPDHKPTSPYVLEPSQGLLTATLSQNVLLETIFEWREEAL